MTADFAGKKVVVVGGSSGFGRETAMDVVAGGGSAVIIGREQVRVDEAVAALSKDNPVYGITADLADHTQVARVQQQLADEHADASLLVNAAGFVVPKPFLEEDGASYDSYLELDRAIFFITQTVVRGMVNAGRGGAIVNIGSVPGGYEAFAGLPVSVYSMTKGGIYGGWALTRGIELRRTSKALPSVARPREAAEDKLSPDHSPSQRPSQR